jgi:hypothetical protein
MISCSSSFQNIEETGGSFLRIKVCLILKLCLHSSLNLGSDNLFQLFILFLLQFISHDWHTFDFEAFACI